LKHWTIALFCAALGVACTDGGSASARSVHHGPRQASAGPSHHARASAHARSRRSHARIAHARIVPVRKAAAHHAGSAQQGHASVYASHFAGRRMADGHRFDPRAATVASRTLPLGSQAEVTNLRNGRTVTVRVTDRGPNAGRRILDMSPGVASSLGMNNPGLMLVSVRPVGAPLVLARAEAATVDAPRFSRR
jgi:rare lipoprotein A